MDGSGGDGQIGLVGVAAGDDGNGGDNDPGTGPGVTAAVAVDDGSGDDDGEDLGLEAGDESGGDDQAGLGEGIQIGVVVPCCLSMEKRKVAFFFTHRLSKIWLTGLTAHSQERWVGNN